MSRDSDLDLDAILAEFHSQEETAPAERRPETRKTASRREMHELAERQAAREKSAGETEKTMLFEPLEAEKAAPSRAEAPAPEETRPAKPLTKPSTAKPTATKSANGPAGTRKQRKKKQGPGKAFALMFLVLLILAAVLAGLLRWTSLAEKAALPQEPEQIRLSLGEDLEKLLDESAASSR